MKMKNCKICFTLKYFNEFPLSPTSKNGITNQCKCCISKKQKLKNDMNKELFNKRTKNQAILEDFLFIYDPYWLTQEAKDKGLEDPERYNIGYLFEKTMNKLTGFMKTEGNSINDAFKDGVFMEWKTSTVHSSGKTRISGVKNNVTGSYKTATIVAMIYNRITDKLDFFWIPKKYIKRLVDETASGGIEGQYSIKEGKYLPKLGNFYVESFDTILQLIEQEISNSVSN